MAQPTNAKNCRKYIYYPAVNNGLAITPQPTNSKEQAMFIKLLFYIIYIKFFSAINATNASLASLNEMAII
jgi:hypothetical protein